jgi:ABC-type dipeptide/oligopeptide/nickel transport system permease component
MFLLLACGVSLMNLFADLIYPLIDPRVSLR